MLNNIYRIFKRLYKLSLSDKELLTREIKAGLKIGKDCRIYSMQFGSEPYLVSIGDHVTISNDVQFITHDGAVWVFRNQEPNIELVLPIQVGDNVFIGARSIILPGSIIEHDVVVGAGSLVKGRLESGFVYAGVPVKKIKSTQEYRESIKSDIDFTKEQSYMEKKNFYEKKFDVYSSTA